MVVGCGHRDVPKYAVEGVPSRGSPGALGGPYCDINVVLHGSLSTLGGPYHNITLNYGHLGIFLGDTLWTHRIRSASQSLSM